MKNQFAHFLNKLTNDKISRILDLNKLGVNSICSRLLINQMLYGFHTGKFDPSNIIRAIIEVENNSHIRTKKERPFLGKVLKGYWYKHWFDIIFMGKNLRNFWKLDKKTSKKLENQIAQSFKEAGVKEGDLITGHAIEKFLYDYVEKPNLFFNKNQLYKLTGERLVFQLFNGKYYYLTLSEHKENDEDVLRRINTCYSQIPFLLRKNDKL